MQNEWFFLKKDPDAPIITDGGNFNRAKYPYFINEKNFSQIEDSVAYYKGKYTPCDILFEPTFLIHDRLQSIFQFLEPELEFKGVQLYKNIDAKNFPMPLYWLPYLPAESIISPKSRIVQGKPEKLILDGLKLSDRRIFHCTLPAADIWILNLEAAECLLRRQPVGIILEKVLIE